MTAPSAWKNALRESNALGWIALMVLVLGVAFGTIYFDSDAKGPADKASIAEKAGG
jgi:hypothetical protein